jgi:hypothetical protein
MDDFYELYPSVRTPERRGRKTRGAAWAPNRQAESFQCAHCRGHVATLPWLSGVQNRNHCPYCLWSKHLDHRQAGDRLSACKAPMRPVGVALKRGRNKYGEASGELMLAHLCTGCGKLSLNRIAADDDPQAILAVYEASCRAKLALPDGISLLGDAQSSLVRMRLFGHE